MSLFGTSRVFHSHCEKGVLSDVFCKALFFFPTGDLGGEEGACLLWGGLQLLSPAVTVVLAGAAFALALPYPTGQCFWLRDFVPENCVPRQSQLFPMTAREHCLHSHSSFHPLIPRRFAFSAPNPGHSEVN